MESCSVVSSGVVSQPKKSNVTMVCKTLSNDISPTHYELTLNTDVESESFTGDVSIHFTVNSSIFIVPLNCDGNININSVWITYDTEDNISVPIENTFLDKQSQMFLVFPGQKLKPDNYVIYLSFSSVILKDNTGLYIDSFIDDTNIESLKFVMSHLEPTFARKVFPCFDEAKFMSTFQINLVLPTNGNVVALSSMKVGKKTTSYPTEGRSTVHFLKSLPMPIYAVSFFIGRCSYIPSKPTPAGLYISVYLRSDEMNDRETFRDLALAIAETAEKHFLLKIDLNKIDIVGLPRSIIPCIVNTGLIFINEKYLTSSERYSLMEYLRSLTVISYGIAKTWLTNFVNIEKWNDYWLREGLVGFFGEILARIYQKDCYTIWYSLATGTFPLMKKDGYLNTCPIKTEITAPVSIYDVYRSIIYKKSVAIMRMIFFNNMNKFRSIMYEFITKEKVLTPQLFYNTIKLKLPYNPEYVFKTFINQKGYPLLEVSSRYGTSYIIERKCFLNNKYQKRNASESIYRYTWDIPIYYICESNPTQVNFILMNRHQERVSIECPPGRWVLINHKHAGYYRVNYTQEKWTIFAYLLMTSPETLQPEDRAGLIENAFCLTNAGYFHYNIPLNLTVYLNFQKETHCLPWIVVSQNLYEVYYHFIDTPGAEIYLYYVRSLLAESLEEDIWDMFNDSRNLVKLTKSEILNMGGWSEEPNILELAHDCFSNWFNAGAVYESNLMKIILRYGLVINLHNLDLWTEVTKRFHAMPECVLKDEYWEALASVRNTKLIKRILNLDKMENLLLPDILKKRFQPLIENHFAVQPAWDFIRNNAEKFMSGGTILKNTYRSVASKIASKLKTEDHLKEVKTFMEKFPETSCCMKRVVESIENNITWKPTFYEVTCEWLHFYVANIYTEKDNEHLGKGEEI